VNTGVPKVVTVDPLVVAVLKAAGFVGSFTLLVYVLYRAVLRAKKAGATGSAEILATLVLALGTGIAPAPPREVKIEQKRDENESGDPPRRGAEPSRKT
jgi:hypothetical protein